MSPAVRPYTRRDVYFRLTYRFYHPTLTTRRPWQGRAGVVWCLEQCVFWGVVVVVVLIVSSALLTQPKMMTAVRLPAIMKHEPEQRRALLLCLTCALHHVLPKLVVVGLSFPRWLIIHTKSGGMRSFHRARIFLCVPLHHHRENLVRRWNFEPGGIQPPQRERSTHRSSGRAGNWDLRRIRDSCDSS